jgi:hypothetical protein
MTKTTRRRDTAEFEAAVYVRLGEPGETLSSVDSGSRCRGDAGDRPDDRSSRLLVRWKRLRATGDKHRNCSTSVAPSGMRKDLKFAIP